jgi:hypothetical protein
VDDYATVLVSNASSCKRAQASRPKPAPNPHVPTKNAGFAGLRLQTYNAIADSGATQNFVMDGTPVANKRPTTRPLKMALADGRLVMSTHMCDIRINGLPTVLTGHIIPDLSIALLFGIRVLTEAGCMVTFDKNNCVRYNGDIILRGVKDPATDLWTLPLGSFERTSSHHVVDMIQPAAPVFANAHANGVIERACFTHAVRTKANSIRFAHHSFCSPKISTLLKALRRRYHKGCTNLTEHGVTKYLNPSPATAKGHMKRPRRGIRSTRTPTGSHTRDHHEPPRPLLIPFDLRPDVIEDIHVPPQPPLIPFALHPNVIKDDGMTNMTVNANLYSFTAFADIHTGTIYNDLTGTFPFMSLQGNVCFLVVYPYKSNAILALPIAGFSDNVIFRAYKEIYEMIEAKGFVIRFNVMDNQASKVIKKFLNPRLCELMLVEPNNHRVNAAERAIQTFKDHFVSKLATTDSEFPLQLWDQLTQHVETTLNLLRPSRIDPTKSAYKALHGPYSWNRFPLAPPRCKAVIYESPESRPSWGSRGTNAWYLGPSLDHYRCNHYFVPETRAYRISGSAEIFPQHCQVPFLMWNEHLNEVVNELVTTLQEMTPSKRARRVLTKPVTKLDTNIRDPDARSIIARSTLDASRRLHPTTQIRSSSTSC